MLVVTRGQCYQWRKAKILSYKHTIAAYGAIRNKLPMAVGKKSGVLSMAPPFKKNAHGLYGNWTCRFVREIMVGVFGRKGKGGNILFLINIL